MKKASLITVSLFFINYLIAQSSVDLTGKVFQQMDNIPNSTTELQFKSKTQVNYIITSVVNGKTYIDECPGKSTFQGNKISIFCQCNDKEIYPDPIKDSFTYDPKSGNLTSTSYRSVDGKYFVWKVK